MYIAVRQYLVITTTAIEPWHIYMYNKLLFDMKSKDPIWNFFAVVDQDKKTIATFIDYKTVVSAKAPRLHAEQNRTLPVDDTPE